MKYRNAIREIVLRVDFFTILTFPKQLTISFGIAPLVPTIIGSTANDIASAW